MFKNLIEQPNKSGLFESSEFYVSNDEKPKQYEQFTDKMNERTKR